MPPTVRRRTAPSSDGYGAAKPEPVDPWASEEDDHPGGTEEFATRRQRGNGRSTGTSSGGRGWTAYKKNVSRGKRGFSSPDEFKVTDEDTQYLIKALDEAPMWSYGEHFVKEITEGNKALCCGGDICPLCDYMYRLTAYAVWDIALWVPDNSNPDGGSWAHKFWRTTPDPAGKMEAVAEMLANSKNPRTLKAEYLMVSKTAGKKIMDGKAVNEFSVVVVKERDLEDDHGAYPLEKEDYEGFDENPFDPEKLFPATPLRELRAAAELLDE